MNDIIEQRAEDIRKQLGGTIFCFPVDENDPFSKYAVTMYTPQEYITFPEAVDITEAAGGILLLLEKLEKRGMNADYDTNVRFITHQAQVDAPNVIMKRLKNSGELTNNKPTGYLIEGVNGDVMPTVLENSEDGYNFTPRGLIKFNYILMVEDKNPKTIQFMNEYYKLLSMRRYGKTASAIKQEVRRMNKDQVIKWIERTYKQYIHDPNEIVHILHSLK